MIDPKRGVQLRKLAATTAAHILSDEEYREFTRAFTHLVMHMLHGTPLPSDDQSPPKRPDLRVVGDIEDEPPPHKEDNF